MNINSVHIENMGYAAISALTFMALMALEPDIDLNLLSGGK